MPRFLPALAVLCALGLLPGAAEAQAPQAPLPADSGFTVRETGAANPGVRISKLETYLVTSSGMLEVRATIENHANADITGMSLGVELEQDGTVRDAFFSENRLSLRDGGTEVRVVDYFLPKSLSGSIEAFAVVRSLGGKTLARESAWSGASSAPAGGTRAPLSCTPRNAHFECSVAKGEYELRYVAYKNEVGGMPLQMFSEESAGGKTYSIPSAPLIPGDYVISVRLLASASETLDAYLYRFSVPGTSGNIDSLSLKRLSRTLYRLDAETTQKGAPTTTLALQWLDRATPCGETMRIPVESATMSVDIEKGCSSATSLQAELYMGDTKLASSVAFVLDGGRLDPAYTLGGALLLIAIVAGAIVVRRKLLEK